MTEEPNNDFDTRFRKAIESIAESLKILAEKPAAGITLELVNEKGVVSPDKWADPEKMMNELMSAGEDVE